MADVSINELPVASEMSDDALSVIYQNYETKSITGALIKQYAKESVKNYAEEAAALATIDAENARDEAQQAQANAELAESNAELAETNAKTAQQNAEKAVTNAENAATSSQGFANNASQSAQEAEEAKLAIEAMKVSAQTLTPGSNANVSKSIVNGVVNLLFGIPQGATGSKGDTGETGASISKIERTSGNGAAGSTDIYTITLTNGNTFTFNVYNGKDGEGSGDMSKSVYDPQNKATDVFKYIDDQMANVDFDITADDVTFADGETFQEKYDSGELKGQDGTSGSNGTDGVGIQSVTQTTTSTEDGGTNVITVTKTDNTSSTFTVKNGSKGSQGEKGDTGARGPAGSAQIYEGTLLADSWAASNNGYQIQDVSIPGLSAFYNIPPDIDVVLSNSDAAADAELIAAFGLVTNASTAENTLSVQCTGDAPSVNVPIVLRVWE